MKKILLWLIISQCFFVSIFAWYQVDIDINNRKNKDAIKELQELNIFFQEKSWKDIEYYEKLLKKYRYEQEIIDNDLQSLQYIRSCKHEWKSCEKKQGNFLEITDQSDEEVINSAIHDLDTRSSSAYVLVKKHTQIVKSLYEQKKEIESKSGKENPFEVKIDNNVEKLWETKHKEETQDNRKVSQENMIQIKITTKYENFLKKFSPLKQLEISLKLKNYLEENYSHSNNIKIKILKKILKEKIENMLQK